jgi:hypothetical protein
MNNKPIIDLLNVQKNNSKSTSEPRRPNAQKSTSERNDNPVSRYFALQTNGKKSMRAAVNAMCSHCMGCTAKEQGYSDEDWIEPGFRKLIRNCTSTGCPLWEFRPYRGKSDD